MTTHPTVDHLLLWGEEGLGLFPHRPRQVEVK